MGELLKSSPYDGMVHDATEFTSGREALDIWLRESAQHARAKNEAGTYVWVRSGKVVAYYALAAQSILRDHLPTALAHGAIDPVPAVLLAKLAIDQQLQGQGLGRQLVADALSRCVLSSDTGPAARVIVIDAIDRDGAAFYSKCGFRPVRNSTLTLLMKMSTARRYVESALAPMTE